MGNELALKKILKNKGSDPEHFLSALPTQLLLRQQIVKGVSGNAAGLIEYIGLALPDALLPQAKWKITKLVYDSTGFNTQVLFANGTADFDKIFDSGSIEYANYTYTTA